jgi:hypothetical protein
LGTAVSPHTSLWSKTTCAITDKVDVTRTDDLPTEVCARVMIDNIIIPNASSYVTSPTKREGVAPSCEEITCLGEPTGVLIAKNGIP